MAVHSRQRYHVDMLESRTVRISLQISAMSDLDFFTFLWFDVTSLTCVMNSSADSTPLHSSWMYRDSSSSPASERSKVRYQ